MAGLPLQLYTRCRSTLLKCSEFDNQGSLQAVFAIAELEPYQDGLPGATNRDERVNKTIDYLRQRYLSSGQSVLSLFLAALRNRRHEEDLLHSELAGLCSEVEQEMGHATPVDIPFVIFAMKNTETAALITETIFDSPEIEPAAQVRFREFREALEEHGIVNLLPRYGERREDWKPYDQQDVVYKIIQDTAAHINQWHRDTQGLSPVRPEFVSEHFFDSDMQSQTWRQLNRSGCVLIVDAVSLFHPILRRMLLQSGLGSNDRVAMLVLSPVSSSALKANELIEQEISSQMRLVFARFDEHLDKLCEFGVGGLRTLQRWLSIVVPDVERIVQNQRPSLTKRRMIREEVGPPGGVHQVIFRQRG